MARPLKRLSSKFVEKQSKPGCYADGGGLYLQVGPTGGKSWLFRYMLQGRAREMGLGAVAGVSLGRAREKANECRRLVEDSIDPIDARAHQRAQEALKAAKCMTFSDCADRFINSQKADWKNPKHTDQWRRTIETYCEPVFGSTAVQNVDTGLILRALEPIWAKKPETASRVRGRIERILDWAKARGHRDGENPARWGGHLDKLLPTLAKKRRVKHHPALPYRDVAEFMTELRAQEAAAARALELLILTSTRTTEAIAARWAEFDLDNATWVIPAERMKAHKEHRVPLPPAAIQLLRALHRAGADGQQFVFTGSPGRHLSNMALLALLRRMKRDAITVHGFRSTFRDWAAECTNYPREVCEMALAHTVSNEVEAAYRRGDLFEKRRRLMADWAKYCETVKGTGQVLSLHAKRSSHSRAAG